MTVTVFIPESCTADQFDAASELLAWIGNSAMPCRYPVSYLHHP